MREKLPQVIHAIDIFEHKRMIIDTKIKYFMITRSVINFSFISASNANSQQRQVKTVRLRALMKGRTTCRLFPLASVPWRIATRMSITLLPR